MVKQYDSQEQAEILRTLREQPGLYTDPLKQEHVIVMSSGYAIGFESATINLVATHFISVIRNRTLHLKRVCTGHSEEWRFIMKDDRYLNLMLYTQSTQTLLKTKKISK